jgi:hypothetical protein
MMEWSIKSRFIRRQPAYPGKVDALQAMRPIDGNETGSVWFAPVRFITDFW